MEPAVGAAGDDDGGGPESMAVDAAPPPPPAEAAASHPATTASLEEAAELVNVDDDKAAAIYSGIIRDSSTTGEALRTKETAINELGEILARQGKAGHLRQLLTELRPYFDLVAKAKTAKIVRTIIDLVAKVPGTTALQVDLCKEMVEWTRQEKRTFLRQRAALSLLTSLVRDVRRLDDKLLLVDVDLLESRLQHQLRNIPKAKAALTAARTAANAIYVPPAQQGQIDMQSGILHAEEKDYKTGYSYFFEGFEAFNALDDPKAVSCLKYMLLCKIMTSQAEDVHSIISTKAGIKYTGNEIDAMKAVADAHSKRSLQLFETALKSYKSELSDDPIIDRHLSSLYDTLLEQNLARLIEPFSKVEISHIAALIDLPVSQVEEKLSQMILDHKFEGTLDQGAGCLIIFDDIPADAIYPAALSTLTSMSKVVDSLYAKSAKIAT
eukprot:SM000126S26352  [mRNA]  locus=s126:358656:361385:+ [translate_table: standard]